MVGRNAEQTRDRILHAALDEMYANGYQGMRIDAVLKKVGLAKGALYHHFPTKKALGYAVIDELLFQRTKELGLSLSSYQNPLDGLCDILTALAANISDFEVSLGCPVNNLSQEMSGLDEGFKQRLSAIYSHKCTLIIDALSRGVVQNYVREDINCEHVACYIIASFQGLIGAAKCMGSKQVLVDLIAVLCDYIRSLGVESNKK